MNPTQMSLLLFFTGLQALSAQDKASVIQGRVTDEKGIPIAFADVILQNASGKAITGAVSDTSGVFRLNCDQGGRFILVVRFMGYRTYRKRINLDKGASIDMGTIVLSADEKRLAKVKVIKNKPLIEQRADRLVFHVENSVAAAGGDALDALSITPRIQLQNGKLSMIGERDGHRLGLPQP